MESKAVANKNDLSGHFLRFLLRLLLTFFVHVDIIEGHIQKVDVYDAAAAAYVVASGQLGIFHRNRNRGEAELDAGFFRRVIQIQNLALVVVVQRLHGLEPLLRQYPHPLLPQTRRLLGDGDQSAQLVLVAHVRLAEGVAVVHHVVGLRPLRRVLVPVPFLVRLFLRLVFGRLSYNLVID